MYVQYNSVNKFLVENRGGCCPPSGNPDMETVARHIWIRVNQI